MSLETSLTELAGNLSVNPSSCFPVAPVGLSTPTHCSFAGTSINALLLADAD